MTEQQIPATEYAVVADVESGIPVVRPVSDDTFNLIAVCPTKEQAEYVAEALHAYRAATS